MVKAMGKTPVAGPGASQSSAYPGYEERGDPIKVATCGRIKSCHNCRHEGIFYLAENSLVWEQMKYCRKGGEYGRCCESYQHIGYVNGIHKPAIQPEMSICVLDNRVG
jgi:hypothetical protein